MTWRRSGKAWSTASVMSTSGLVKEGCGMPDSLKPVKSYDWTDEEWLRLMREMDPREEISAIERRVAEWRDAADDDAG